MNLIKSLAKFTGLRFLIILRALPNSSGATDIPYLTNQKPQWLQLASLVEDEKRPLLRLNTETRRTTQSWALAFDNDVFVPGGRDQDYTYGINFTQTGNTARTAFVSLNKPLVKLDNWLGNKHESLGLQETFSREIGVFGFTPENIGIGYANPQDRPYASLAYLASSREQINLVDNLAWKSTLTIGVLGLGLAGELQDVVHEVTRSQPPQGWDNQISEGGELTGRYVIARQKYLDGFPESLEVKSTVQASFGYLTEASWSLSLRSGRIHSPWSSFNPELASYGEKSSYSSNAKAVNEHYFWAGIALKARAYNAFLQGQFRNSAVTYDQNQLNPLLVEAWAGYTFAFKQGYRLSYVLRGHSSEIKDGAGDRDLLWGGIIIARSL